MAVQINVVGTYNGKELDRAQKQLGNLSKDVKGTGDRFKNFGSSVGSGLKKAAIGVAGLAAGITGAGYVAKKFIDAGSDLEESMSKVNVVFGEAAQEVKDFAKNAAVSMGISNQKALEATGTYGNLLQAFGSTPQAAAEMSTSLVSLAGDLASFNNVSVDDAILALRSGLSGETEPLKRFGVAINDVRLKEEALKLGLYEGTGALSVQAKSQAAYALILKDTTLAQGDYARTADGVANASRTIGAQFQDIQATIGTALLPAFKEVLGFVSTKVVPGFTNLANAFTEGGLSGAITFLAKAFKEAAPKVLSALKEVIDRVFKWVATDGVELAKRYLSFLTNVLKNWVLPALPGLLRSMGALFKRLIAFLVNTALPAIIDKLKSFGDALVDWLKPVLKTLPKELMKFAVSITNWLLTEGVPKLVVAAASLGKALLGWLVELAGPLVQGLASAFLELIKAIPRLALSLGEAFLKLGGILFGLLITGMKNLFGALKNLAIDAVNLLIEQFNKIPVVPNIDLIKKDVDKASTSFDGLAASALDAGLGATNAGQNLKLFGRELGAAKTKTVDLGVAVEDVADDLGGKGKGKKSVSEGAKEAAERLKDMAKSFEDVKKSVGDFGEKVGGALMELAPGDGVSPPESAVMNLDEFRTALEGVTKVGPEAGETLAGLVDTISERLVDSLKTAKERLDDAKQAFKDFARDVKSTILGTLDFSAAADKEGEGAGKSFIQALTDQAKKAVEFGNQVRTLVSMGLSQDAIGQVLAAGQEAGSQIAKELIAGGVGAINETNALIEAATAAAQAVGEFAATAYFQAGIDNAEEQIAGLRSQIEILTPKVMETMDALAVKMRRQVKIDVKVSQSSFDVNVFVTKHIREVVSRQVTTIAGARAEGGPVSRSMAYLVGEKGPEIFVPNQSGNIIPNGGSGTTINLTVNAGMGTNGSDVGDAIVDALTRYQRRNGAIPVKVSG